MEVVLLAVSFAVILAGALLFTNAVEWAGNKLGVGEGATGSILAAVGTAMPETLIPIVAIIGGAEGSEDVAIGAIIGAPFLLATVAMALVGISALAFKRRREQGTSLRVHVPTLDRDLVFFLIFFAAGILIGVVVPEEVHIPLAIVLVVAYAGYVRATLRGGGEVQEAETIGPLYMDRTPGDDPPGATVVIQLIVGLAAIVREMHGHDGTADVERELVAGHGESDSDGCFGPGHPPVVVDVALLERDLGRLDVVRVAQ